MEQRSSKLSRLEHLEVFRTGKREVAQLPWSWSGYNGELGGGGLSSLVHGSAEVVVFGYELKGEVFARDGGIQEVWLDGGEEARPIL